MKLYERLPDRVTADGHSYRVDLEFRNVLRMMEVMGRDDLIPQARDWLALRCIMRRPPRDWHRRTALLLADRSVLCDTGIVCQVMGCGVADLNQFIR